MTVCWRRILFAHCSAGCVSAGSQATAARPCLPSNLAIPDTAFESLFGDRCPNEQPVQQLEVVPATYPDVMRAACREGEVRLRAVIDTLGKPDMATARVV